ncbi:MAG: alkaline phosphatase D family protein [Pirellulaceae bacterium]
MSHIICVFCLLLFSTVSDGPFFASGIKVGEATQTTAIVWVRLTKNEAADFSQLPIFTEGLPVGEQSSIEMPDDVVPGTSGQVQMEYWIDGDDVLRRLTDWVQVTEVADFTHQFRLASLQPGSLYRYQVNARASADAANSASITGSFRTALGASVSAPVKFIVTTCQAVRSVDAGQDGHVAYQQMLESDPDFFVHTGDIVYYDKAPLARSASQARAKWHLMFAYGHQRNFHRFTTSYFMKDDHDTLKNDCWPGQRYGDLTFAQGCEIFREQVCMSDSTYRTIRWGRDVQVWFTENRDFRSSNQDPDGPDKTILGQQQKDWLLTTMAESDATFRFIISPGPIVGPDKRGKADNHSNAAFTHEGQQLRDFIATQPNTYVICGDRHWQYCSEDPVTGVVELGCGPVNDQHNFGGNPGRDASFHRYFSDKGGFLVVSVDGDQATAEWVHSGEIDRETGTPRVLHTERFSRGR